MNGEEERDNHLWDRECCGKWESILGGAGFVIKGGVLGMKLLSLRLSWLKFEVLRWLLKENTISSAVGHVAPASQCTF